MSDYFPIDKQIKKHLELIIAQNRHNPNYILPSENQLAQQFHSSRSPAKKALADLRAEGLIYSIQGKGTFIKQGELKENDLQTLLIIPHAETPFMRDIVKGIRDFFFEKNIHLLITFSEDDPQLEEKMINYYTSRVFSGLLLFPIINATYHDAMLKLALSKRPVVAIAHYLPGIGFSSVHCDNYQQIHSAVSFLSENGHTNIGLIAETEDYNNKSYRDRFSAFRDYVKNKLGKKHAHVLGIEPPSRKEAAQAKAKIHAQIDQFFDEHKDITAVIVSAILAKEVLERLKHKNDPQTPICAIIIDEPENVQNLCDENVYILDQSPYEIGQRAALQLYDQIVNSKEREEIILPYSIRPSTDFANS